MSWYIIGAAAVVIALLFSPVTIYFEFLEKVSLKIRFFVFTYDPFKPKKEKKQEKKQEKKPKKTNKPKKSKEGKKAPLDNVKIKDGLNVALKLLRGLKRPLRIFLKRIKIKDVNLEISVGGEDSAKIAVSFGTISALVFSVLNLSDEIFTLKTRQIAVYPDYLQEETRLYLKFLIKINLFSLLAFLISTAKNDLKTLMDFINPPKN